MQLVADFKEQIVKARDPPLMADRSSLLTMVEWRTEARSSPWWRWIVAAGVEAERRRRWSIRDQRTEGAAAFCQATRGDGMEHGSGVSSIEKGLVVNQ